MVKKEILKILNKYNIALLGSFVKRGEVTASLYFSKHLKKHRLLFVVFDGTKKSFAKALRQQLAELDIDILREQWSTNDDKYFYKDFDEFVIDVVKIQKAVRMCHYKLLGCYPEEIKEEAESGNGNDDKEDVQENEV